MTTNTFEHISLAGTYVVKSGSGYFHTLVINTTVASTIVLYDGTSATGRVIASLQASAGLGTYFYGLNFLNGLTIVTAGDSDITVSYT